MPPKGSLSTRSFSDPIFWIMRTCSRKSSSVNSPESRPFRVFFGLLLIDDLLEVLHQADDVAHAEDAARHAVGAEGLELVGGLADAAEDDGRARDLFHAERRAAARVAVELGEHDALSARRSWNARAVFTASWPIIASTTRKMFSGLVLALDVGELLHERFVDREAPAVS
jgi:hypothetical protein